MAASRARGFESIHVDLIYGLPQQSPESFDRTIALTETAPGLYAGTTHEFAAGTWIADADVQDPQNPETDYRIRRRLWLTP